MVDPLGENKPGLSPRVRGNRTAATTPSTAARSIPACAGEPLRAHPTGQAAEVYPRVCGGTREQHQRRLTARGLSPRVRGNQPLGV